MERKAPAARGYARYYCLGRKAGISECPPLSEKALIERGLPFLATTEHSSFSNSEAALEAREAIVMAEAKLTELSQKAERLVDALEQSNSSAFILERLNTGEKEKAIVDALVAKKRAALATLPASGVAFGRHIAKEAAAAIADKKAVEARHKISVSLAQLLSKIVWHGSFLMFHTKEGVGIAEIIPEEALARAKNRNTGKRRTTENS